jgi:hypothetical protein
LPANNRPRLKRLTMAKHAILLKKLIKAKKFYFANSWCQYYKTPF